MKLRKSKKSGTKSAPAKIVAAWTRERVDALYDLPANTPRRGSGHIHAGEPHEWELEAPEMPPVCLGCNMTGDQVENAYDDDAWKESSYQEFGGWFDD